MEQIDTIMHVLLKFEGHQVLHNVVLCQSVDKFQNTTSTLNLHPCIMYVFMLVHQ